MRTLILATCFLGFASNIVWASDKPLQARADMNWRLGTERSILMTEFWVPLAQSKELNNVLYTSLRMMGDDRDNREGNLGVGYRQLTNVSGLQGVAGFHGWLDRRVTERSSAFHQVTAGLEWLGESVDVRLNGYIPLSDKRQFTIPNATPQAPELAGTGILIDTDGTVLEEPQGGVDLELGLELGQFFDVVRTHTDSVRLYGGVYYFDGPNTEDVAGWRTRLAADVTENIQFGARFQRDDVRGSQGFLEATFRFPFGHKKSYREEGLRARLDESPERDIDIVTNETITDSGDQVQVLNATTGTAQEVLHVDNIAAGGGDGSAENPFNTLSDAQAAASAHTIIYVKQGDGTDTNQDQGITLNQTGQQLIGSGTNFVYDSGRFTTANGASPTGTLIAAATSAPVIGNVNAGQDGVTITADNVTVAGLIIDNDGTGRDGIVVRADGVAASAQNIMIQDVTATNARMGIYLHGTNSGAVSAKVERSVATGNSQHGIAVYDDTDQTFEVDLGGGSMGSQGLNVLAGNMLEDLAVDYDGRTLAAQNNWWGQASGPDIDTPDIGIAPQIYYGAPINDGLVGHWTFDTEWTTNTTAYDRSGLGNDGTLLGGLSLTDQVAGQNREGFEFDGISKYVRVANLDLSTTDAVTVIMWRNIPDFLTSGVDFELSTNFNSSDEGFVGALSDTSNCSGRNFSGVRGDVGYSVGCFDRPLVGTWNQITHVFDKSWPNPEQIVYYNAVLQARNSQAFSGDNSNNFGSLPFFLMSRNGGLNASGLSDNYAVYSRTLDSSEISELYRMDTSSVVNTGSFLTSAP